MGPFRRFGAWQACFDMVVAVYRETATWPKSEQYGLTAQLRRAATSAGANIAEGAAKRGRAEFGRYLDIAIGSLAEVEHLLLLARELGIAPLGQWQRMETARVTAARLTHRLYQAVRPKGRSIPSP
jgi:four helix bundle protein